MKRKRTVVLAVVALCLAFVGWLGYNWYSSPIRKMVANRGRLAETVAGWWSTPISFYGKVLDEKGNPIPDADVEFLVNDASEEGTSEYHRKSDQSGFFSITGIRGKHTSVTPTKEGYYSRGTGSFGNFTYAGGSPNFVPDPKNPVVFHLRKKGEATALYRGGNYFDTPKDGTPVEVDLKSGKVVARGQGHIRVECWIFDQTAKRDYPWRCRFSVPGGGLVETTEEFPFEAPLDGYLPSEEWSQTGSEERWMSGASRKVYLKLGDGNYALLDFMLATQGVPPYFKFEYYLNPTGSRNLEYDKAKRINK